MKSEDGMSMSLQWFWVAHSIWRAGSKSTMRDKMPAFRSPYHHHAPTLTEWTNSGRDGCATWTVKGQHAQLDVSGWMGGTNVMCARLKCESSVCSCQKGQHGIAMQSDRSVICPIVMMPVKCYLVPMHNSVKAKYNYAPAAILTWHCYVDLKAGIEWKYHTLWSSGLAGSGYTWNSMKICHFNCKHASQASSIVA